MKADYLSYRRATQMSVLGAGVQLLLGLVRAVAAGCTVVVPYERKFWGDDWGLLVDPFGIKWGILQPGPDAPRGAGS
ncbi:hypothetical protein J4558_22960 [Leptolyngbya sp. 15MV]|nr:hypothetical protein J4558_22960 [Leptolyngbya sp. 15MV]